MSLEMYAQDVLYRHYHDGAEPPDVYAAEQWVKQAGALPSVCFMLIDAVTRELSYPTLLAWVEATPPDVLVIGSFIAENLAPMELAALQAGNVVINSSSATPPRSAQ